MTLSAHLLDQMDNKPNIGAMPPPNQIPLQTPIHPNGYRSAYQAGFCTPNVMGAQDGSQWSSHHGGQQASPWGGISMAQPPWMGTTPGRFTTWSEEKVANLQVRLTKKLGPEYITQRPGPGGGPKLSYLEGWKAINLANDVFGFNGWSSSIISIKTDFLDVNAQDRCFVGITAIIRITLQDGCYHEDIGYGHAENVKGKAAALEKAQKEAVTDGLKRALKHFGNVLGNCLYDRDYTKEVQKVKVGPTKFNVNELERRPEFAPQTVSHLQSVPGPSHVPAIRPPMSGNPRTTISDQTRSETRPNETPSRDIDEMGHGETLMDENFENEFASIDGESFFDEIDRSISITRVDGDIAMAGGHQRVHEVAPHTSTPKRDPSGNILPLYHHRQRPDVRQTPQPLSVPVELLGDQNHLDIKTSGSSKVNGDNDLKTKKAIGMFVLPNPPHHQSAASARAAAIAAALAGGGGPIRAQSPRIPSGGIDAVAARATTTLRAQGVKLDLENGNQEESTTGRYSGFASARGVKRGGSLSPTKPRTGHAYSSSGTREALSELPIDGDTSDGLTKRTRVC